MGLSRTVSEINGDLRRKFEIFPPTVYFAPTLTGFSLDGYIGAKGKKTRMMGLQDGRKRFMNGLAV